MVTELATEPATPERRLASDPRVISGAIGACVGLLIAAVFGIRALASAQAVAAARPDVEVATVTSSAIRAELLYTGTVQGAQQANVSSLTAGMIAALHVDTGATVRAGDRLASLDAGALPLQLLQARADLQSAEAKRAGILGGATTTDIGASQAALTAAQAKLDQLLNPTSNDIAVATATLSTSQAALSGVDSSVENTRAILYGTIANGCVGSIAIGLPCGNVDVPLTPAVIESLSGFLTSRGGDPKSDLGARAVAVLQANAAYNSAVANAVSARDSVRSAQAKLDTLRNPTAADVSAQRATVEAARNALERKLNSYTDADVQAANATVAQARAQVGIAETNLNRMTIAAPFDGVVAQRLLEVGVNVTAQTPVFVLIGKAAEVHVAVRDEDVAALRADASAELSIPGTSTTLKGRVRSVATVGDQRSHTFDAKVIVEDPNGILRPGTLTQVRIVAGQKADVLVVPSTAVFRLGTAYHALTVVDGKIRQHAVTVGISNRTGIEITGGLKAGDTVVVRGQQLLRDGQSVQARPMPTATPTAKS